METGRRTIVGGSMEITDFLMGKNFMNSVCRCVLMVKVQILNVPIQHSSDAILHEQNIEIQQQSKFFA